MLDYNSKQDAGSLGFYSAVNTVIPVFTGRFNEGTLVYREHTD